MSPSPITLEESYSAAFRRGQAGITSQLWQGASWSGHERNCVFLNTQKTGSPRFANISAVSHFDFDDDARGIGLADRDGDGDLDAWVTARYPVQLRCLESNATTMPGTGDWLQIRVEGNGTTVNRDALGTRVALTLKDDSKPIIRTVRAGGAFLSQSSKTLHFGLGQDAKVERAEIIWPDGEKQILTDLPKNTHLSLTQSGFTPLARAPLNQPAPAPPFTTPIDRTLFVIPSPAPPIPYITLEGKPIVFEADDEPTLVLLWATWCAECLDELSALVNENTPVLALCVDGLGDERSADLDTIRATVAKFTTPNVTFGRAMTWTLQNLQRFEDATAVIHRELAVPGGFLIDAKGNISATYRGAVPPAQFRADSANAAAQPAGRLPHAAPFPGRWMDDTITPNTDHIARTFRDEGDYEQAERLFAAAANHWPKHPIFLQDHALALQQLGHYKESIPILKKAARYSTDHPNIAASINNNLGVGYAKTGNRKKARHYFEKALELDPKKHSAAKNLELLNWK